MTVYPKQKFDPWWCSSFGQDQGREVLYGLRRKTQLTRVIMSHYLNRNGDV